MRVFHRFFGELNSARANSASSCSVMDPVLYSLSSSSASSSLNGLGVTDLGRSGERVCASLCVDSLPRVFLLLVLGPEVVSTDRGLVFL